MVPARGIESILTSAAAAAGVPGFDNTLGLPDAQRRVVLLIDGLGERQLREYAEDAPFLANCTAIPGVRSVLPSTTVASLTSFGTGLRPGQHGVAGYTVRVPETGRRINVLKWDEPIDPDEWQPHPRVLGAARDAGVTVAVINEGRFVDSGLTRLSQGGVPFIGYTSVWERLDLVADAAEAAERTLVYAYESRLDHAGHGSGVGSDAWRKVLREIDAETRRLREELPADVSLVITADHGMINLPDGGRFDVDEHPRLLEDVDLVAGEARFRHLYTREGAAADVAARWHTAVGDHAEVRLRADAEEWLGPIAPSVARRIGDVIVASVGDFAVFSSKEFPLEMKMKGFHGSITDEETAIPLLLV